jgi:hypothetical protein
LLRKAFFAKKQKRWKVTKEVISKGQSDHDVMVSGSQPVLYI